MSKSVLFSIYQTLKKCFQILENNQKIWNSVLAECKPLMVSLGNLEEQLRAFQKVQIANTPLHTFPDLHQRLHFKLIQAVDIVLGKLTDKMCSLQSVRDAISNQVSGAFQLYEQNIGSLDLATCTHRSAVAPSIADMLEWLQDAERYYRQQYPFLCHCINVPVLGVRNTFSLCVIYCGHASRLHTAEEGLELKRINSVCGITHFEIYHLEKVLLLICVRKIVFLIYMYRFLRRKNLLLTLRADDLSLLQTAPKRWESLETPSGEESISDTLFKVSFFIESQ
uniref:Uncharacterized protein n=1 Tax=Oncorhynchus mykiss TaxID=8022 RepID=A0A8K9X0B0_ONCMY